MPLALTVAALALAAGLVLAAENGIVFANRVPKDILVPGLGCRVDAVDDSGLVMFLGPPGFTPETNQHECGSRHFSHPPVRSHAAS